MNAPRFTELLTQQVGNEFAASQQYIAVAAHYDAADLPRLATLFYRQSVEERNHAMMMIQFLLDTGEPIAVPGVSVPRSTFSSVGEPVALALEQERRVSDQCVNLARVAREEGDYQAEQFMQWFLKEQIEEVSSMSTLLKVIEYAGANVLAIEDYLAREDAPASTDQTAPAAAGGAL